MNSLISIFIPGIFGVKFIEKLSDKKIKTSDLVFYYLMLVLFTNCISVVISYLVFGLRSNLEMNLMASPIFSIKYIALNVIVSIILGIIISIIRKYVSISLELEKNDKKKN